MAKPHPKTCHTQISQLFSIFRFFLWFRYTNAIGWNTSFASPVTLSMFFTMGVWLRYHASQRGCKHETFKKFNFSFSSTLIKIIMCLSCKRVVVASVYQRSFNLIHYFFQNRSLTLNMSEIGTPPLRPNKIWKNADFRHIFLAWALPLAIAISGFSKHSNASVRRRH